MLCHEIKTDRLVFRIEIPRGADPGKAEIVEAVGKVEIFVDWLIDIDALQNLVDGEIRRFIAGNEIANVLKLGQARAA